MGEIKTMSVRALHDALTELLKDPKFDSAMPVAFAATTEVLYVRGKLEVCNASHIWMNGKANEYVLVLE